MISAIFYKIVTLELNVFKMIGTIRIVPFCRRKRMNLQTFLPSVFGKRSDYLSNLRTRVGMAYSHRLTQDSSVA